MVAKRVILNTNKGIGVVWKLPLCERVTAILTSIDEHDDQAH